MVKTIVLLVIDTKDRLESKVKDKCSKYTANLAAVIELRYGFNCSSRAITLGFSQPHYYSVGSFS